MSSERKRFEFFVDAKPYSSEESSVTGQTIKEIAGVPAGNQLFLEMPGPEPDKQISDGEAVDLSGPAKHFFVVPPATFGDA